MLLLSSVIRCWVQCLIWLWQRGQTWQPAQSSMNKETNMRNLGIGLTLAIIAILAISGVASAGRGGGHGNWGEESGSYGVPVAPGSDFFPPAPGGKSDHGFQDANQDGICDYCGETPGDRNHEWQSEHHYYDGDGDGVCDYDGDGDGVCDIDGDGVCDYDADGDGVCDYGGGYYDGGAYHHSNWKYDWTGNQPRSGRRSFR